MRERKLYPNISDEELDRRAEEALKRMLANQKVPGQPITAQSGNGGGGHNPNRQGQGQGQGRRKRRNRPPR